MRKNQFHQLALAMSLSEEARLDNFVVAPENEELMFFLEFFIGNSDHQSCYLWGNGALGKTHLLQALCMEVAERDDAAAYVDFKDEDIEPDILEELEEYDLVSVDNVHVIAGNDEWEQAFFHCYNRLRDAGTQLVMAANQTPQALGIRLPDLVSRLTWAAIYRIHELDDDLKRQWMVNWCHERGMKLNDDVAKYLMTRAGRDMHRLDALLHKIDEESLLQKRKLTLPFVREVCEL